MTAPPVARFTREEFLRLPESSPGFRFELVDGELVTMNDPLPLHQVVVGTVYAELRRWCRAVEGRGRVLLSIDTEVGPDAIVGPDLQWLAAGRELPDLQRRPWPAGDLVIEVASPSTERYDAGTKLARYLAAGSQEVWLVTPEPLGVRIVRPDGERRIDAGGMLTSGLLPGFELRVAELLD
ncbi:Uma2 family endonuclease [Patulibacter sp.]|uniref:Uma2 family endonuclease n=1 Tax=Patulibacter sp. TaxID=1912859 RepID=UPI002717F92E|nr:Uma2 family endonuclease [Patulibacter sp.]MDO9410062.1 Uma2 family endonuclease [Patulibacter sp.]